MSPQSHESSTTVVAFSRARPARHLLWPRVMKKPRVFLLMASTLTACGGATEANVSATDAGVSPQPGDAGVSPGAGDAGVSPGAGDGPVSPEAGDAGFHDDDGAVTIVPLSGCYETHTLPVTIGNAQTFNLAIDTGASTLGVAADGCAGCEDAGLSPLYNPGSTATDLKTPETLMYAPGFGWSGEAYQDVVSIGGLAAPVDLVAITSESQYFFPTTCDTPTGPVPGPYEGTIGFGPDAFILPGTNDYIDQVVDSGRIPNAFSIAFCHVNGTLWLGGYDVTSISQPMQYTPMGQNAGYTVEWTDAVIDGTDISLPAGTQATVDSGGIPIFVLEATYNSVASALSANAAFQTAFGASFLSPNAQTFSNCVTLNETPAEVDAALPPLTLKLGSANPIEVSLTATESYLAYTYLGGSQVSYCQNISVSPADGLAYYVGMSLMLGHVLEYDRANMRFGIAGLAQTCPF
jgi:hypothetical protein